ncbi:hypothetical protein Cgig2_001301 [Carnegiea gigantea]|uniref:Uncharacterized protein n=1 Tax=Carnegiea gigantea TaxID=171969 RepID=A0A9Q1JTL2_9CARY|nr:hypothetical protein Cgig2_001301 [Carnegiea gigantea]
MFDLLLQVEHRNWFCNHLSNHLFSMHQLKRHDDLGNCLPHLPCSATTNESHQPCQPPQALGTSQVQPLTRSAPSDSQSHSPAVKVLRESRESPSNGNNEDLVRSSQSKSIDKGKGLDGGKKNKSTTSKTTRSARSSWKDNIQFDAKEEVLTIDDLGKEEQYKHGLKKDYFKLEEKMKEDMYDIVPKGHSHDGWTRLVDYWCSTQQETLTEIGRDAQALQTYCHTTGSTSYAEKRADFVETHGREQTHLEFFKETHSKEGGRSVANTAAEGFLNEASAKVQERRLSSSPSKTQVEIENEVFHELMYEEENSKRSIGFGFNVDRSDVFSVNSVLRKRGYVYPDNNMELRRVKEELASQKVMFLLMLKAVRNRKITNEFLDATKTALRMAGDHVQEESSGNDLAMNRDTLDLQPQPPELIRQMKWVFKTFDDYVLAN